MQLGTAAPISYLMCWQGNSTVLHWGMYPTRGKQETWVISPEVMSPTGFVWRRLLFKEKYHLWDFMDNLWQHINYQQLGSMWRYVVDRPLGIILKVDF